MMSGVDGSCAPSKGCVSADQNAGYSDGIQVLETVRDGQSSIQDIISGNLVVAQLVSHRNGAVEVIGVSRAEGWNFAPGLGPRGCVLRVRMHDAADRWELAIEMQMCGEVRRWPQQSFHYI